MEPVYRLNFCHDYRPTGMGAVKAFLLGLGGSAFTLKMFMAGALFDAIPGIILHLALIPLLVYGLEIKK